MAAIVAGDPDPDIKGALFRAAKPGGYQSTAGFSDRRSVAGTKGGFLKNKLGSHKPGLSGQSALGGCVALDESKQNRVQK